MRRRCLSQSSMRPNGMALLSVAVALGLAAAVGIAMLLLQRVQGDMRRASVTIERMERIRQAACAHARLNNGALPSLETPSASPPRPAPTRLIAANANSANLAAWGVSFADTVDGWGRLISVFGASCASNALHVDTSGSGSAPVANACLVLVSHGKTGFGAFLPSGGGAWLQPLPTGSGANTGGSRAEWRNARGDSGSSAQPIAAAAPQTMCASTLPHTDPGSPCHFDDIVRHYTQATLCH